MSETIVGCFVFCGRTVERSAGAVCQPGRTVPRAGTESGARHLAFVHSGRPAQGERLHWQLYNPDSNSPTLITMSHITCDPFSL